MWVFCHIGTHLFYIYGFEHLFSHHLVDQPLCFAHMDVHFLLTVIMWKWRWVQAQKIEADEIGHDIFPFHHLSESLLGSVS